LVWQSKAWTLLAVDYKGELPFAMNEMDTSSAPCILIKKQLNKVRIVYHIYTKTTTTLGWIGSNNGNSISQEIKKEVRKGSWPNRTAASCIEKGEHQNLHFMTRTHDAKVEEAKCSKR